MKLIFLTLGFFSVVEVASAQSRDTNCFLLRDNARLTHQVHNFADLNPKGLSTLPESSAFYPGSIYSGRPTYAMPATPSNIQMQNIHQLWANRCHFIMRNDKSPQNISTAGDCANINPKSGGNEDLGVIGRRAIFSSYAKANACTVIQARRLLGGESDAVLTEVASRNGLEFLPRIEDMKAYWLEKKEKVYLTGGVEFEFLVDKCVAPTAAESPASGISLDYEVADFRNANQSTPLFFSLAKVSQRYGKLFYVFTNPLTARGGQAYGINRDNFRTIISLVDQISINLSTGAAMERAGDPVTGVPARPARPAVRTNLESYNEILDEIERDSLGQRSAFTSSEQSKIMWGIGLYDTDLAEAKALYKEFLINNHYAGVAIQRHFVSQGGKCDRAEQFQGKTFLVNQVIACLSFGDCNGRFGL